jgi:hypothetical protein
MAGPITSSNSSQLSAQQFPFMLLDRAAFSISSATCSGPIP